MYGSVVIHNGFVKGEIQGPLERDARVDDLLQVRQPREDVRPLKILIVNIPHMEAAPFRWRGTFKPDTNASRQAFWQYERT